MVHSHEIQVHSAVQQPQVCPYTGARTFRGYRCTHILCVIRLRNTDMQKNSHWEVDILNFYKKFDFFGHVRIEPPYSVMPLGQIIANSTNTMCGQTTVLQNTVRSSFALEVSTDMAQAKVKIFNCCYVCVHHKPMEWAATKELVLSNSLATTRFLILAQRLR